jgi:uncharacterized protein YciI
MPWFVKIEKGVVPKAEFDQYVPAHKAYVQGLIDRGHQALTGYWKERGGGMMVFEAASLAEAEQIINQDPLVQNHCVAYDPAIPNSKKSGGVGGLLRCKAINHEVNQ